MKKKMKDGITWIYQENGATLSLKDVPLLEKDGFVFKNLSGESELLPYEDWRVPAKERAKDLASRMSLEEIAGLMLYSPHQVVPFYPQGMPFKDTYHGESFDPEKNVSWELSDGQKEMMKNRHIRHILQMSAKDTKTSAKWSNELQAYAEKLPWGIPVKISTDPRHGASSSAAEFKSGASGVSKWPEGIGMAATFSADTVKEFAQIAAKEYRALGISCALGPQIDLSTEPRWMRMEDTFGSEVNTAIEFTRNYCDGMQTTKTDEYTANPGWGSQSVATMIKHWPGGGTGEAGRDAHYPFGAYAVYPGDNFKTHLRPFTEGGFRLNGPTGQAASVMPYYTVSYGIDKKYGKNVGNAYSTYLIKDLLRDEYEYDGIVCTDWGITQDYLPTMDSFSSRCYGVWDMTEAERHLLAITNGVDQFGGNSEIQPILDAYKMGCDRFGETKMRARMEKSAERLLSSMFCLGLFENPYLDAEESEQIVGCEEHRKAGLRAQQKSVVVIKNKKNVIPLQKGIKVYVPERHLKDSIGFMRWTIPGHTENPVLPEEAEGYFTLVDTPEQADVAFVWMESPITNKGYDGSLEKEYGTGYLPISLQYRPYTAETAREVSLAGGDPRETTENRSYRGRTNTVSNENDLDNVLAMRKKMGDKPVIVCIEMHNPTIPAEFEAYADGIVVQFGVQKKAIFDVIFGRVPAEGRLPYSLPINMEQVERHCEDLFDDIEPYTDELGNTYKYGFGMKI